MAPTPANKDVAAKPVSIMKRSQYWSKPTIAFTAVFATLALGLFIGLIAFLLHRRSKKRQIAKAQAEADRIALLEKTHNKRSLYSGHGNSNMTLASVSRSEEANDNTSQESSRLIQPSGSPAEEPSNPMSNPTYSHTRSASNPMNYATYGHTRNFSNPTAYSTYGHSRTGSSSGSGVSSLSRTTTETSRMFSPVSAAEESDLGIQVHTTRPRSTSNVGRPRRPSTASRRYYDMTPSNNELPPVPTIIHTTSD